MTTENNKSDFLKLKSRDFIKGLIISVLTVVITGVYNIIQDGRFPDSGDWKKIGLAAISAFCAYIIKNFFTNSQDEFVKRDKPKE